MKLDAKPQSFSLNADGLLRRVAAATLLASASGLAMAQVSNTPGPAPVPATTPDSPTGTTTQGADATSLPAGSTPSSDAPSRENSTVNLDKVTVTGTRIRSLNSVSTSPVTTVGAAELKYQGTTRVEDLLNSLPQSFAGQGSNVSNGSDGTATVDLRGLGPSRTLVLIDGKRLQPGDPRGANGGAADLNFIPSAMIERIDVLTGGASAVYGADAVAGVVNFQLRKNFEGLRVDVQRSGYEHNNNDGGLQALNNAKGYGPPSGSTSGGQGWDASALLGVNTDDGRGNLTGYVTYRQINAIKESQRDYSNCTLGILDANNYTCSGSSTSANGRFLGASGGSSYSVNPNGAGNTFRTYSGARDAFNFGPYNYFQRNDERYTFGALGRYKFNDAAEAYTQLMFMNDRTDAVIAPSGSFFGGNTYTLSTAPAGTANFDPLLSDQQRAILRGLPGATATSTNVFIGRRNVEGGGRDDSLEHTAYRLLGGLRGDLPYGFNYDVSTQIGVTTFNETYRNDFSNQRLIRALDVVADPTTGAAVCRSALNGTDPNCVPYNIFAVGGVTPAAVNYLQVPLLSNGRLEERVATASLGGIVPNTRLPTANEGLGVSAGLEYRSERASTTFDNSYETGDGAGQGGARHGIEGAFRAKDIFAEAKLPLLNRLPGAYDLNVETGFRHSSYDKFDSTNAFKYGLNWEIVQGVKLRGGFNRAVRTPSVSEIASPVSVALDGATDPCAGTAPTATAAQCAHDPYFATHPNAYGTVLENPAGQYNGQVGSSPGLRAETARTFTYGLVLSPAQLKGLTLSVDYYHIKVDGYVAGYGADTILQNCYQNNALCNLVHRDPNTGSLWIGNNGYVIDTTQNTGRLVNRGIDINAGYRTRLRDLRLPDLGSVNFDLVATRLLQQEVEPIPGAPSSTYECVGHFGTQCGIPQFKYRQKLRSTWVTPWYGITGSVGWRYFSRATADVASIQAGAVNNLSGHVGSVSYIDLYLSAKPVPQFQNLTARIGVNNVMDKRPPIVNSGAAATQYVNGNTFSQVYDTLGRYLFAGVQIDFGGRSR